MDKAFLHLLTKYLGGTATAEECQKVEDWYNQLGDDSGVSLSQDDDLLRDDPELEGRMREYLLERARRSVGLQAWRQRKRWVLAGISAAAAAVLFLFLMIGLKRTGHSSADSLANTDNLIQWNEKETPVDILLPDSSLVRLFPGSRIEYPRSFVHGHRNVWLAGEAFFDVRQDPRNPFIVYDQNLVAEVLGTSFTIRQVHNRLELAVHTGKVKVFENGQKMDLRQGQRLENGVIVTANERVTYSERHLVASLVDTPRCLPAAQPEMTAHAAFDFDDEPLSRVLQRLEEKYGIQITLEDSTLKDCPFTGDLDQQSLFEKLDLICSAVQAHYDVEGTRIWVRRGPGRYRR